MSLSPEEYREHLATTAVRAGFSFGEVTLPQSHEFHLGRMRFHYLDWGNKHLPPMVFLHGGALNAHTWDLVSLALRDEYRCIALDQRGHGDSDWSPDADYSMSAQLADTKGFVDHLGLDRFILVGMSLGAINSLAFAIAHPERLNALVIIDAGPEIRRPGHRSGALDRTVLANDYVKNDCAIHAPLKKRWVHWGDHVNQVCLLNILFDANSMRLLRPCRL